MRCGGCGSRLPQAGQAQKSGGQKKHRDGRRKNNQAAYEVQGFRLFDKVKYEGQIGFIFGRRSIGYFDVRRLDGTRISASANYKKLRLLQKRKSYLTELRT